MAFDTRVSPKRYAQSRIAKGATEMAVSTRKPGASYVVKIVGSEHGTLQGTIQHTQSGERRTFRGCLEMLHLLESWLCRTPESEVVVGSSKLG